jgi:phosphopantothenoylcysteine synthetase/decarboxylase
MKKKILITAGNTWSPLDNVRVITNIFSGETGLMIADKLANNGFKVTLILADCRISLKKYQSKNLKIIRALTYDSFYMTVKKEAKKRKYSAIIHSAAISDFRLKKPLQGKISSQQKIKILLYPTKKIVNKLKKWSPHSILVKFKLEANKNKKELLKIALASKKESKADLIVANSIPFSNKKRFFLIKSKKKYMVIKNKNHLAKAITNIFLSELL